jgi:hypothetical protein
MMTPLRYVLLLILMFVLGLFLYPWMNRIEHRTASREETVSGTVGINVTTFNHLIHHVFDMRPYPPAPPPNRMPPPFDKFVADEHIPATRAFSVLDPALAAYIALPDDAKENDVYLYDPLNRAWTSSEYYYLGKPAQFSTKFIVHLTAAENAKTIVEILEYQPQAIAGYYFGWSAHTGPVPGFFGDSRWVAPTNAERRVLLSILLTLT